MKKVPYLTRNKKQSNDNSKDYSYSISKENSPKKNKNYLHYIKDETYGQIMDKLKYYNIQLNTELVHNQNFKIRNLKKIRKKVQSNIKDISSSNISRIKNQSPIKKVHINNLNIIDDYNYKIQTNITKYFKKNISLINKENSEIESHLDTLWKKLDVNKRYIHNFNLYKNKLNNPEDKKIFMINEIENLENFNDILINLSKEIEIRENKLTDLKSLFDKLNNENDLNNLKNILTESNSNIISYIENSIRVVEYYLLFKEMINKGNNKNIKFNDEKIYCISKYSTNYLLKMKTDTNFINIKKINEFKLNTSILNLFKADPFLTCLYSIIQIPAETKEKIKYCQYYIIQEDIYESLNKKVICPIPNSNRKIIPKHIKIDAIPPNDIENNTNIKDNLNISYFTGKINEFKTLYSEYFEKIPEEQKIIFNINKDPMKYFEHNYYPKIIICKDKATNIIKGLCIYSVSFKSHEKKPNEIKIEHISSYNKEEMENIITKILEFIKDNNVLKNICKISNKSNTEIFINLFYNFVNEKFQIDENIKNFFKKDLKFKWVKLENISKVLRFQQMKLPIEKDINNDHIENNYNLYSNISITDNFNINLVEKIIMNNTNNNGDVSIIKTNPSNIIYIINLMKKIDNIKKGFEYLLNKLNKFSTKKDLLIESTNNDRAMSLVLNDFINNDLNINSFVNDIQSISKYITGNSDNELNISNKLNIFPLFDGCMSVKYKNYFYNRIECKNIQVLNESTTEQRFYSLNTVNNENITILISSNLNEDFKKKYLSNINNNECFNIIDNFEEISKHLKKFNSEEKNNNNYIYIPAFSIEQKYEQKNVENSKGDEINVINSFNGDYKMEFLTEELIAKKNKKNIDNFEFNISKEELKNENLIDDEFVIIILDSNVIDKIGIIPAISIYVHKNNFISDSI